MGNKLAKVEESYRRDESKIRICPAWVIYSMPIVLVAMIVCFIEMLLTYKEIAKFVTWCAIFLVLFCWSMVSDKIFSMYENCRISFEEGKIVYKYDLNRSVMPSSNVTTTIIIYDISNIRVRGDVVVIKGNITRKAPLKKDVHLKKVELPINFVEKDEIIEKLQERV